MDIKVITLFPEMFHVFFNGGVLGKAVEKGIINIDAVNIRDYTLDKHNRADDTPFGGGAGMVMMAEPVFRTIRAIGAEDKPLIYMSPKGKLLDEKKIRELAERPEMFILCGHYEGIDERILEAHDVEEISIGDYILTGGETGAMVLIDAVSRMIPGVLGNSASVEDESVYSGLLEYPQYTKPREYEGMEVPSVLLSGNHREIDLWRFEQSLKLTKERRPDMFERFLEQVEKEGGHSDKRVKKIIEKVEKGQELV